MGIFSGLFAKTSGEGWSFDDQNGRLTISGLLKTDKGNPFAGIKKRVCSVVALKGARIKDGSYLFSEMRNLRIHI